MTLPDNIESLIQAQNNLDSTAFAEHFTNEATVADEGHTYSGRAKIKEWIQQATEKYRMQTKPIDYQQSDTSAILTVEVTGTFPGSPIVLHYHLGLEDTLISSLSITG